MKKLLFILLALPVIASAQTEKPKKSKKSKPTYYYDSLGIKHNRDSAMNVAIKRTMDSMKARGYVKPN